MTKILIAEDDQNTLTGLTTLLEGEGYQVLPAVDGETALAAAHQTKFDILLTDMKMPSLDGMELIYQMKTASPDTVIIMMTAFPNVEDAVQAWDEGAYHYMIKPINPEKLLDLLRRAVLEHPSLQKNVAPINHFATQDNDVQEIKGKSPKMQAVFERIAKVARSNSTVLIRGESGTGKELVAKAIHYNSSRRNQNFVLVNCAAIPENLLESELFGYERGAFTDAKTAKKGRFELADGGTIFLDEVGEISGAIQVKLLRVLQDKSFERLGGIETRKVDVRVIAATNADLEKKIKEGTYREDLYYRLNVIPIPMPPLRARREDIPLLIEHFIDKYSLANNILPKKVSKEVYKLCCNYSWPGNVRELENAVESALVLSDGDTILPEHLPFNICYYDHDALDQSLVEERPGESLAEQMERVEREILKQTLERFDGNRTKAAQALHVTVRTIQYKIKKYRL